MLTIRFWGASVRTIVLCMLLLGCSRAVPDLRPAVPVSPPSQLCRDENLGAAQVVERKVFEPAA